MDQNCGGRLGLPNTEPADRRRSRPAHAHFCL